MFALLLPSPLPAQLADLFSCLQWNDPMQIMQERENIFTAFPKCKSSCIIPCCIAIHYIFHIYIKKRQYSVTCIWNKHTLYCWSFCLRYSTWVLHRRTISGRAIVVSRVIMLSSLGTPLHPLLFWLTIKSLYKFTGASSSQECCQSVNKVTPRLDVPRFPCGYAVTQLSEQLELITPSPCCRASRLRKLLSMNQ